MTKDGPRRVFVIEVGEFPQPCVFHQKDGVLQPNQSGDLTPLSSDTIPSAMLLASAT